MTAKRGVIIRPEPAVAVARAPEPTVWQTYSFAPEWFADALGEARTGGHDSRRREILFSVCFAESYLFEWVRDVPLSYKFDDLVDYFPVRDRRSLSDRWKEVPKQLLKNGLITQVPVLGGAHGQEWQRLLDYRHGLVHALASRPQTTARPKERMPVPSKTELDRLPAGWAVRVVIERVRRLHDAAGRPLPEWLVEP